MAYIEGESLEEKIRAGPLPLGEAVEIASQLGGALEQAHAAGIIHGDVKPANVIVEGGAPPQAVILDFASLVWPTNRASRARGRC